MLLITVVGYFGVRHLYVSADSISPVVAITNSNNSINLQIYPTGNVKSLQYKGQNLLNNDTTPISTITMSTLDANSKNITYPASNFDSATREIKYGKGSDGSTTDIATTLKIVTTDPDDRLIFSLSKATGDTTKVQSINLFDFSNSIHNVQQNYSWIGYPPTGVWADGAADTEPFIETLPMNSSTICNSKYQCYGATVLGLTNAKAALIVTPKKNYFAASEALVDAYNLPKPMLNNKWFRDPSNGLGNSYNFVFLSTSNSSPKPANPSCTGDIINDSDPCSNFVTQTKEAGFKQALISNPLVLGSYNTPNKSTGLTSSQFQQLIKDFQSAGIEVGIHTFNGQIQSDLLNEDSLFAAAATSSNPASSLGSLLYKVDMNTKVNKTGGISETDTTIPLGRNLTDNTDPDIKYYANALGIPQPTEYNFLIDNEIVHCSVASAALSCPTDVSKIGRGSAHTKAADHSGSEVYLLPPTNPQGNFWLDPNLPVFANSTASFTAFMNNLKIIFFYFDGSNGIPTTSDPNIQSTYAQKNSLFPYLKDLTSTPIFQIGQSFSSYDYYYSNRLAFDPVSFKQKGFLQNRISLMLEYNSIYFTLRKEFGWFGIHGADLKDGNRDIEATSPDDIDYVMTKTLAMNSSISVGSGTASGLSSTYKDQLYKQINSYLTLLQNKKTQISSDTLKSLQDVGNEAYLALKNGFYSLTRKKVVDQYVDPSNNKINIDNPFDTQKLNVEIKPRPDFYTATCSSTVTTNCNTPISDFKDVSNFTTSVVLGGKSFANNTNNVTCGISNGGKVTITNNSTSTVACKFALPGNYPLSYKRGVGLGITGVDNIDPANLKEMVVVDIANGGNSRRDFQIPINSTNFKNQQNLILADPAVKDNPKMLISPDYNFRVMASTYSWASSKNNYNIYIYVKPSTSTYHLTLNSLTALSEKIDAPTSRSGTLVNPSLTIGGKKITFPVTLYYADADNPNILNYDGNTGVYNVYTSNRKFLSTGTITNNQIIIPSGISTATFSSDTPKAFDSQRADVKITTFDNPIQLKVSDLTIKPDRNYVIAGKNIQYSLAYNNTSDYAINNASLEVPVSSDFDFVSAANGGQYDSTKKIISWSAPKIDKGTIFETSFVLKVK